jgi:hypothetical protein
MPDKYVSVDERKKKKRWKEIMETKTPEEKEVFETLREVTEKLNSTRGNINLIFGDLQNKIVQLLQGEPPENGLTLETALRAYNDLAKSLGDVDKSLTSLVSEKVKAMKEYHIRVKDTKSDDNLEDIDFSELG